MNLFNVESDFIGKLDTKPRRATDSEVKAYLGWQRERRGLADLKFQGLEWSGGYMRGKDERFCIGATYGNQTAAAVRESGRWEGDEYRPGTHTPAQWENGSYSLLMPGYAINRATVTMETLNDAGEVVASQTLPAEPKKGGVVWTKETIRAACGPVAKVAKPRKGRATPTAEPARKAKRTPAHERAIRMAWAQRKARRRVEQVSADRFAEIRRLNARSNEVSDHYRNRLDDLAALRAKRRRAVLLARDLQNRLSREFRLVDAMAESHRQFEARLIAERDEAREWAALLEEENAALTRSRPKLRLVA